MLADRIVLIAKGEIGIREATSNRGRRVDEYKSATNLPPHEAWAWCAAFVDWVVQQAMKAEGKLYTFERPTTAGAWDLEAWSLRQNDSTQTKHPSRGDIKAGDIIIYTFHHTGFATSAPDKNGNFSTIEGNTNKAGSREGDGVWAKRRPVSDVRARIRFTV